MFTCRNVRYGILPLPQTTYAHINRQLHLRDSLSVITGLFLAYDLDCTFEELLR